MVALSTRLLGFATAAGLVVAGLTFAALPASAATDLAAGKAASADSSQAGHLPPAANDDDLATRWCANDGKTGHWWQVDLGATASLTDITVTWEFARNYKYRVAVSPDSTTWTTVVDKTANTSTAQTQTDAFTGTGRYVRITVTGLAAATWASLKDVKVSGAAGAAVPVSINVDAGAAKGPLKPVYRFFGADEPNYATMPDGKALLADIGNLGPAQAYFRTHSLMVTGDGTPALKWGSTNMYTEDAQGRPVYDWTIVDQIFDTYLANNVKPYVQIGFMPKALSTHPDPYQHHWQPGDPYGDIYTGWAYPPKDYDKWRELVFQWVTHAVAKYGRTEAEQWYWEVWNEPNNGYWQGTAEEFRKLHDYAIDGVRKALPTAKVGGPEVIGSGGQWMKDFLQHQLTGTNYATGKVGTPIDFVSFHAKGSPTVVNGNVRMGISNELTTLNDGFKLIASYPELKPKPIVIGEADPDGCAACSSTVYPQNAYRNTSLYASYTAASFARAHQLADRAGVNLEGLLTWSYEFEDQPMFAGFRVLSTEGDINLPVFNVFRMFGKMGGQRLTVNSTGEIPLDTVLASGIRGTQSDVSAMAALNGNSLAVLAWNYHDDDVPGPDAAITYALNNIPAAAGSQVQMVQYQIDAQHSNAYTMWQQMGSPATPTAQQMATLKSAGQLQTIGAPQTIAVTGGTATVRAQLPRQGVSLMVFSW